jgi:aldehyde dehydrogenase (NAD+)
MEQLIEQRNYFNTGVTLLYDFRKKQLQALLTTIDLFENEIYEALNIDLKKSKEEVWVTEIAIVRNELKHAIANVENWMQQKRRATNFSNLPGKSYTQQVPLGVVLIIAPWNYPFQLLLNPLVGAIAAGNCVALKASEYAPAIDAVMQKIIAKTFDVNYISYHQGDGAIVVPNLINVFVFDHIFYTGSTQVGKIIYKLAAENLVPVTLELGGKSPAVVAQDANITIAAKRIALPKYSNCGQMCVAPDYVLVHESKKEELIIALKKYIVQFFGNDAMQCYNYGKIINEKQYNRLIQYLQQGTIEYGGKADIKNLYIEPTIITNVNLNDSIMQDEIFGPILPILTYTTNEEAKQIIEQNKNPLAFYVFTNNKKTENYWLQNIAFGGACVNNAAWHLTNHHLPFGGVGNSGTGGYHGKKSFETFSHQKSIMKTPTWIDLAIKYPPFKGKLNIFKKLIR